MLKYNHKDRSGLGNLLGSQENKQNSSSYSPLNPKFLPVRPPPLNLPNKQPLDLHLQTSFTPNSSRSTHYLRSTMQLPTNRSNNVTPESHKRKKDSSFKLLSKFKLNDSVDGISQKEPLEQEETKSNFKNKNNQSFKEQKSRFFKDLTNQEGKDNRNVQENARDVKKEVKNVLRQTISNATSWKIQPPPTSPLKTLTDLRLDKSKSTFESNSFRKKIQSEYMPSPSPAFPPSQPTKDSYYKPKISSTHHSRQNSFVAEEPSKTEALNFRNKAPKFTQRISQDKIIRQDAPPSSRKQKDKLMSQTDPVGNYFNLANIPMSKKTSSSSVRPSLQLKIQDFQLGSCKGQGRFGKVFPAVHKKSGFLVAVKQIKKEDIRLMIDQFIQELKINIFASHPNIVKMYGFFSDRTYFYILMEYMQQGSLYKQIKSVKKMKEGQTSCKLYQICDAVHYLHSQEILHRDIKPENIVLSHGVTKLCDFGWAIYSKERRNTYCGTLDYVCPEILEGQSYDNFVDIWAVGVLAYEMLTGKAPFYHISRKQTMKSIMNCDFSFPAEMSANARMFITKALQKNPGQRFTIQNLLHDKFVAQNRQYS